MRVRFEIVHRDGLARTGLLELDGKKYTTPAIAFLESRRYMAPEGALKLTHVRQEGALVVAPSAFSPAEEEAPAHLRPGLRGSPFGPPAPKGPIAVPPDAAAMLLDSKRFVETVAGVKGSEELLKPLYCPIMGLPHRLAFLVYCGFDIFDSVPLVMAAETGGYLTPTGVLDYGKVRELPCPCPACSSGIRDKEHLLEHNYAVAQSELKRVRHAIETLTLRELVEARIRAEPWLVQNLRLLDFGYYGLQEMHAPVRGRSFHAGSKESLYRPDVQRWRRRLVERYRRPNSARILLLIPCSARKPYSLSQSHRRFRETLLASGAAEVVHEVIVTSPLGLVPRELELFYPAKDYDIPVTGHWDADETRMVQEMVSWLVQTQSYELVISHLGDEREVVNSVLDDFIDTSLGHPGSREALESLEATLKEHAPEHMPGDRALEDMRSLCRFQFGEPGAALCEGAKVTGRWPNLRIVREGVQLGMLTGERGMLSLTMEGARVLARQHAYCVEIEDFVPRGNIFAVGVRRADQNIRIGDDVAVVHGDEVRAVGVAQMSPLEMELAERGEAVRVRHSAR